VPTPFMLSAMLRAIDLVRVDIDSKDLFELEAHYLEVLDVIAGLNDYVNRPGRKSAREVSNAEVQTLNMGRHLIRLRAVMNARRLIEEMAQASSAASVPAAAHRVAGMGGRSRVIRPLPSADNAAPDPFVIPQQEPTAHAKEAQRGGEAKGAEFADRQAKPAGERSEGGERRA